MRRASLLAALLLCTACAQKPPADNAATGASEARTIPLLPLIIRTAKGDHRFNVEVALSEKEQEQGLMFRKSLDADSGMLFPMEPPRTASFWMKNTLIPLDMLFIHTDGSIAFLKANAQPYSREPVSAGIPVAAVLELRGGRAAELNIKEGDRVHWGNCAVPDTHPDPTEGNGARDRLNFCPAP